MDCEVAESSAVFIMPTPRPRLRIDLISMITDSLIIWDAVSIMIAGYLSVRLYLHLVGGALASAGFVEDAHNLSIIGGLLAIFVLRDGLHGTSRRIDPFHSFAFETRDIVRRVVALLGLLFAVMFLTQIGNSVPRMWTAL
jgi:hypothetical protein